MAFTGRAIYNTDVFQGIAEDVSPLISMISPSETPLLEALGDAPYPATNVLHEWLEDKLSPTTLGTSLTINDSATALSVHSGGSTVGTFITVGAVMKENTTGEYVQVTATSATTLTIARGFGSTTAATITAGEEFTVIAMSALEGADVSTDTSRPRSRLTNYCQIFKEDVIVSGTDRAVSNIGLADEYEYQVGKKVKESLRDLETAVILGKLSGNTLGSSTAYRTMKGLWDFLATNSTSVATLSASVLDDVIQAAWGNGAQDLDVIVADPTWGRLIDGLNSSRVQVANNDPVYRQQVTMYAGSFAELPVIKSRWMPNKSVMVLATDRVNVLPLKGRSFQHELVSKTGDSTKGMVLGEYVLEVMNEDGVAKAYG
jgi:hypothetical protein